MSKMHYFSHKFSKSAKRWGLYASKRPLTFGIGDQKLSDSGKLWLFIYTNYDEIKL